MLLGSFMLVPCVGALSLTALNWGPSGVALDVVPPGGETSTGSGEGCSHLGLGECSGAGGGRSHRVRHLLRGGSSL